ncbi:MAG: ATP-binding protein [Fibrobacteraceae bacterium]|nr:ATP-binding protein [Fibrobacteraceae bacterium]
MILSFGAQNFFSFAEGFEFSFNCGKNAANVMGIKGANASGKTNVLRALAFIGYFANSTFDLKPDEDILVQPFLDNKKSSSFFCHFSVEGQVYYYEFEVTRKEIVSEILKYDGRTGRCIFKRKENMLTLGKEGSSFASLKKMKLRSNASVISTANQYEFTCISPIYNFFAQIATNVTDAGMTGFRFDLSTVTKFYNENPAVFNRVKLFLASCDSGISDIKIRNGINSAGESFLYPVFIHATEDGQSGEILARHEALGSLKLYQILWLYFYTLDLGGVLAVDEFDCNLHPDLLPKLVELFGSTESNPRNAQFIFSTHDTSIMDNLGKYRIYLVNKKNNASYIYRLDELPSEILRNDRKITPLYRRRKIGGVPNFV